MDTKTATGKTAPYLRPRKTRVSDRTVRLSGRRALGTIRIVLYDNSHATVYDQHRRLVGYIWQTPKAFGGLTESIAPKYPAKDTAGDILAEVSVALGWTTWV